MGKRTKITPELVQKIWKLRADGVTLREIVELTGVCAKTAMKLTADMENVRRLAPRVSREQIERMQMLRREGLSQPEISAECGISLTTVRRHTAGIQPEGRKLLEEKIRQLYLEGKTYAQIEEETGAGSWRVTSCTKDLPRRQAERCKGPEPKKVAKAVPPLQEKKVAGSPETEKIGGLCRHKETCRYWRHMSGLDCYACHYPVDNPVNRPWPADQCPGFPGPKTGPNQTPMGIKRKE